MTLTLGVVVGDLLVGDLLVGGLLVGVFMGGLVVGDLAALALFPRRLLRRPARFASMRMISREIVICEESTGGGTCIGGGTGTCAAASTAHQIVDERNNAE